jgi:hypothetical protein
VLRFNLVWRYSDGNGRKIGGVNVRCARRHRSQAPRGGHVRRAVDSLTSSSVPQGYESLFFYRSKRRKVLKLLSYYFRKEKRNMFEEKEKIKCQC